MKEWPKTLVKTLYEGTVAIRGIKGNPGDSVDVVLADLARELAEALTAHVPPFPPGPDAIKRRGEALARYEREVGW